MKNRRLANARFENVNGVRVEALPAEVAKHLHNELLANRKPATINITDTVGQIHTFEVRYANTSSGTMASAMHVPLESKINVTLQAGRDGSQYSSLWIETSDLRHSVVDSQGQPVMRTNAENKEVRTYRSGQIRGQVTGSGKDSTVALYGDVPFIADYQNTSSSLKEATNNENEVEF